MLIAPPGTTSSQARLSYKFQRLRERLRQAITSGELSGKLPGERELAKRFNANPKTLSKALTDLAGEGLLDRSIGRGTFIKGQEPETRAGRWMVLCAESDQNSALVQQVLAANPNAQAVTQPLSLRPSFINQFDTVLDLNPDTPESFRRSMLIRGMALVRIGHEGGQIVTHAITPDRAHAAWKMSRDMFLAGHRRIIVVSSANDGVVADAARAAANRYGADAAIIAVTPQDTSAIVDAANTAILCDGESAGRAVAALTEQHPHLTSLSIGGVGLCNDPAWSGIYTTPAELAQSAFDYLRDLQPHRPCVLHLSGQFIDRGTLRTASPLPMALSA